MAKNNPQQRPSYLLILIILSQFAGTSLWFASNAILSELTQNLNLPGYALGYLTSSVQFGFIVGTLIFAYFLIADRFSPSKVFMISALSGALFNAAMILPLGGLNLLMLMRFLTGICLAGIYPVGMKIAADWYEKGLGKALGYLVGALVLGTAFPHFLKFAAGTFDWKFVVLITSGAAAFGGILVGFGIPDGPFRRKSAAFNPSAIREIFRYPKFRGAAFGYFGHMWELYAFWAFIPIILEASSIPEGQLSIWSFIIISSGCLGCIIGGYIALRRSSYQVAFWMLAVSFGFCLISPLLLSSAYLPFILAGLLIWGFTVVGDSPQFSTMVAQNAPKEYIGSALTIVNCIGFSITIFSIQLLNSLQSVVPSIFLFFPLFIGPLFGLINLRKKTFN